MMITCLRRTEEHSEQTARLIGNITCSTGQFQYNETNI